MIVYKRVIPTQVWTGSDDPLGSQPGGALHPELSLPSPGHSPSPVPSSPQRNPCWRWLAEDVRGSRDSSSPGGQAGSGLSLTSPWEDAATAETSHPTGEQ